MIDERKNVPTTPTRTYCKRSRPLPYSNPNSPAQEVYPAPLHHPTTPPTISRVIIGFVNTEICLSLLIIFVILSVNCPAGFEPNEDKSSCRLCKFGTFKSKADKKGVNGYCTSCCGDKEDCNFKWTLTNGADSKQQCVSKLDYPAGTCT